MMSFLVLGYLILSISLLSVFQKAGLPGWKALIPGLNLIIWNTMVGRPRGYPILLLVPIVNIFVLAGLAIDLSRSFNRLKYIDSLLAVLAMPWYFLYLGLSDKIDYEGPIIPKQKEINAKLKSALKFKNKNKFKKIMATNPYRKSWGREWIESLTFGILAAAFIRMFLIEAYAIPTSSNGGFSIGWRSIVCE